MKRIIEGKRYDTKAVGTKCVGEREAPCYTNDFHWWYEALYRTKQGRWFVAGEGNALSHWARACVDGTGPGEGIRPLTTKQALEWLEQGALHAEIEAYFGDDIEDA